MKTSRSTVAKTEIQQLLANSEAALSHAEIQEKLNGLCDRVTIYRVLERLIQENAIHKIANTDGTLKYASCHSCSNEHRHDHIHFSCEKCKTVTCLEQVEPTYRLPQAYTVKEANFTLTGICPQCA